MATFSDPARYRLMCHRAFDDFEQRLNWRVFTRKFVARMQEQLALLASEPTALTAA